MTEVLMRLDGVSRCYGSGDAMVWALRDVSLSIHAGDFVSIVGPSGSGKSTMLGLLGCLDSPTSGSITVGGTEVTGLADGARTHVRGQSIGFVFQAFHVLPHLDVADNVALPLLLGIGVAFKIYYIVAWRSGRTNLLQSSLTRAIFFSAMKSNT